MSRRPWPDGGQGTGKLTAELSRGGGDRAPPHPIPNPPKFIPTQPNQPPTPTPIPTPTPTPHASQPLPHPTLNLQPPPPPPPSPTCWPRYSWPRPASWAPWQTPDSRCWRAGWRRRGPSGRSRRAGETGDGCPGRVDGMPGAAACPTGAQPLRGLARQRAVQSACCRACQTGPHLWQRRARASATAFHPARPAGAPRAAGGLQQRLSGQPGLQDGGDGQCRGV